MRFDSISFPCRIARFGDASACGEHTALLDPRLADRLETCGDTSAVHPVTTPRSPSNLPAFREAVAQQEATGVPPESGSRVLHMAGEALEEVQAGGHLTLHFSSDLLASWSGTNLLEPGNMTRMGQGLHPEASLYRSSRMPPPEAGNVRLGAPDSRPRGA